MQEVFDAVRREREYQDNKHGSIITTPHDVTGGLLLMEEDLNEAKQSWIGNLGEEKTKEKILQVIAVGVACLEQLGVSERD